MDPLSREAIRIYRRYEVEIVEALKLCPWAERARLDGHVTERVVLTSELDAAEPLRLAAEVSTDRSCEIALILFPNVTVTRAEFERFVANLVTLDTGRYETGMAPFAMAAFHPEATPDLVHAERLVPFLRRTPDPTIQLVRVSALDRVREGFQDGTAFVDPSQMGQFDFTREETLSLRERIARTNLKTIQRVGVAEIDRRLASIRADRAASYAAWQRTRAVRAEQS